MLSIIDLIESTIQDYETRGHGKIYAQTKPEVVRLFQDFWLSVLADLESTEPLNLNNYFYDNISDFFIKIQSYLGKTLETSGSNLKILFTLFIQNLNQRQRFLTQSIKFSIFLEYFNATIDELVEADATIDSSKLLKIVDFYAYTDSTISVQGFNNYTTTKSLNIRRFNEIFKTKVLKYVNELSSYSDQINSAIADSSPSVLSSSAWNINESILAETWGGEGKKLSNDLKHLKSVVESLGGSEASVSGRVELVSEAAKILNLVCFGVKNGTYKYSEISNKDIFGSFYKLYSGKKEPTRIYGLKFLEPFLSLKSFNTLNPLKPPFSNKIIQKFYNGFPDKKSESLSYEKTDKTLEGVFDVIRISLINLVGECNSIGDIVDSTLNSLRLDGSLENFKGLGNIKYILQMLRDLFVPTYENSSQGLNRAFNYFSESLFNLVDNISQNSLNGEFIEKLIPFLIEVQVHLDSFKSTLEITGVRKGELISNINARLSKKTKKDVVDFLRRNNYSIEHIEYLSEITSFDQLLEAYADDFVDSQDIISFFKAYEQTEYLYLLAGERGIYSFLDYLNNPSISNVRKIYELIERNLSKYQYVDRFKLGKLVGTLLHINRATNLDRFMSYASMLKAKNSDIFQSLKVLDALQIDPLKQHNELNILNEFIDQLASGSYEYVKGDIGCEEAFKKAPLAMKKWIGIFDSALGSANIEMIKGFLNNNFGITPKELETYFRTSDNKGLSTLGGMLSGVSGGRFTKLLRHLALSGSLVSMSTPSIKTTSQRFLIQDDLYLRELYEKLENLSRLMSLVYNRLLVGFDVNTNSINSKTSDVIKDLAHKPLELVKEYFNFISKTANYEPQLGVFSQQLREIDNQLPPGIGGSPTDYIFIQNYIPPERVLYTRETLPQEPDTLGSQRFYVQSEITRWFLKTDYYNETSRGIEQSLGEVLSEPTIESTYQPIPNFDTYLNTIQFKDKYLSVALKQSPLGGYDVTHSSPKTAYDLCTEASGKNCQELKDSDLFSAYTRVSGGVPIQRDMFNVPEANPSEAVLVNSYKSPPTYYRTLSATSGVGVRGEPLSTANISEVQDVNLLGLRYDYSHTNHALNGFGARLRHSISSVKDCLEFENDLPTYTKCVNYIRCYKARLNYPFCF